MDEIIDKPQLLVTELFLWKMQSTCLALQYSNRQNLISNPILSYFLSQYA